MAGAEGGTRAIIMALVGNGLLTVIKLLAYLASGSGAMLAEAIHSAADLGNQALLYIGMKKSRQGPSEEFHFGHGKDRFLFALISAAGIFFIGCGISVTHGVHDLLNPSEREPIGWVVVTVLAVSLLVDGVVLLTALRTLNKQRQGQPWLKFLKETDDTTTVAVVFEDGAATLGVILAALGIAAAELLGWHWADATAAILIGLLLGVVALFLGHQNRSYLLDRALSADVQARILGIIRKAGSVEKILEVRTRVIGAEQFAFNADIEFDGKVISDRVQERMDVKAAFEALKSPEDLDRLLDEHARVVVDELGQEVDRLEAAVRTKVPGAAFIRIEVD